MGQVLLESLTGRQLLMFGVIMFCCMASFFVIGGTKGKLCVHCTRCEIM